MKMDPPEYQKIVLRHIRRTNKFEGCTALLPIKICVNTVINYRKHNDDFDRACTKAFEVYKALHPDENQNLIIESDKKLEDVVRKGWIRIIDDIDPKTEEVLKRRVIRSPNIPMWAYNKIHPDRNPTEQGVVAVTGNMYKDLNADEEIAPDVKAAMLRWLGNWTDRAIEELQLRGINVKKELLER